MTFSGTNPVIGFQFFPKTYTKLAVIRMYTSLLWIFSVSESCFIDLFNPCSARQAFAFRFPSKNLITECLKSKVSFIKYIFLRKVRFACVYLRYVRCFYSFDYELEQLFLVWKFYFELQIIIFPEWK